MRKKSVIQFAYEFPRLNRQIFFKSYALDFLINQELKCRRLLVEFRELYRRKILCRLFPIHIVNTDFAEIAHHNPPRFFLIRQIVVIPLRLLKRGQFRAVALLFRTVKVNFRAFLLYNRLRFRNVAVDVLRRTYFHSLFKVDNLRCIHRANNFFQ